VLRNGSVQRLREALRQTRQLAETGEVLSPDKPPRPGGMRRGELKTAHLVTHPMTLDQGPRGYDLFKNKKEGCVRAVFQPGG